MPTRLGAIDTGEIEGQIIAICRDSNMRGRVIAALRNPVLVETTVVDPTAKELIKEYHRRVLGGTYSLTQAVETLVHRIKVSLPPVSGSRHQSIFTWNVVADERINSILTYAWIMAQPRLNDESHTGFYAAASTINPKTAASGLTPVQRKSRVDRFVAYLKSKNLLQSVQVDSEETPWTCHAQFEQKSFPLIVISCLLYQDFYPEIKNIIENMENVTQTRLAMYVVPYDRNSMALKIFIHDLYVSITLFNPMNRNPITKVSLSRFDKSNWLSKIKSLLPFEERAQTALIMFCFALNPGNTLRLPDRLSQKLDLNNGLQFLYIIIKYGGGEERYLEIFKIIFSALNVRFSLTPEKLMEFRVGEENPRTLLYLAAENGEVHILTIFVGYVPKAQLASTQFGSPLFIAVQNGHSDAVSLLAQHLPEQLIFERPPDGVPPLFMAIARSHFKVIEILIGHRETLSQRWRGMTPLFYAVHCGRVEIVKILMRAAPEQASILCDGKTPLQVAERNDNLSVMTELFMHWDIDALQERIVALCLIPERWLARRRWIRSIVHPEIIPTLPDSEAKALLMEYQRRGLPHRETLVHRIKTSLDITSESRHQFQPWGGNLEAICLPIVVAYLRAQSESDAKKADFFYNSSINDRPTTERALTDLQIKRRTATYLHRLKTIGLLPPRIDSPNFLMICPNLLDPKKFPLAAIYCMLFSNLNDMIQSTAENMVKIARTRLLILFISSDLRHAIGMKILIHDFYVSISLLDPNNPVGLLKVHLSLSDRSTWSERLDSLFKFQKTYGTENTDWTAFCFCSGSERFFRFPDRILNLDLQSGLKYLASLIKMGGGVGYYLTMFQKIFEELRSNYGLTPENLVEFREPRANATLVYEASASDAVSIMKLFAEFLSPEQLAIPAIDDSTPLYIAAEWGHAEIVEILANSSPIQLTYARKSDGITPIFVAIERDHLNVISILTHYPAALSTRYSDTTPLYFAVLRKRLAMVRILKSLCPDQLVIRCYAQTPQELANTQGDPAMIEALR